LLCCDHKHREMDYTLLSPGVHSSPWEEPPAADSRKTGVGRLRREISLGRISTMLYFWIEFLQLQEMKW
jgi:hypothetical protein